MPDGILPPSETTAPELAAETADGRLLRRVRRNLVLWSGGTTLLILVALAVALYVAAARLARRAPGSPSSTPGWRRSRGERPNPDDRLALRLHLRRRRIRDVRVILDPDGNPISGPRPSSRIPPGLPDEPGVEAAAANGRDVRTAEHRRHAGPRS